MAQGQQLEPPKRGALKVLKDAKLVEKVYPLPGEKRSMGLYMGKVPSGTGKLPI